MPGKQAGGSHGAGRAGGGVPCRPTNAGVVTAGTGGAGQMGIPWYCSWGVRCPCPLQPFFLWALPPPTISSSGGAEGSTGGHPWVQLYLSHHCDPRSATAVHWQESGCGGPSAHCRVLSCCNFLAEHLQPVGEVSVEVMLLGTGGLDPVTCCQLEGLPGSPCHFKALSSHPTGVPLPVPGHCGEVRERSQRCQCRSGHLPGSGAGVCPARGGSRSRRGLIWPWSELRTPCLSFPMYSSSPPLGSSGDGAVTWPGRSWCWRSARCPLLPVPIPRARSPAWAACAIGVRDSWGFAVNHHMLPVEILRSHSLLGGHRGCAGTPRAALRCTQCQGLAKPNLALAALGSGPYMAPQVGPNGGRGTSCQAVASCEGTARMGACSPLLAIRTWGHLPWAASAVVACWGWD